MRILGVLTAAFMAAQLNAATIALIDFEDPAQILSTTPDQFPVSNPLDPATDYFTRTSGADIEATFTNSDGFFFAGQDLNGPNSGSSVGTIEFNPIDISGFTQLAFEGLFATDNPSLEVWDEADFVRVEYSIDAGMRATLIEFQSTDNSFNNPVAQDLDFDGVGEGTLLTDTFELFTAQISELGNSLSLFVTVDLDSGNEDIAFDNFTITGTAVPEPSSLLALSLVAGAGVVRRRRRNG